MRYDFKSESCISGVVRYIGLALVGVLGSDDAEWSWFLLVRFFFFFLKYTNILFYMGLHMRTWVLCWVIMFFSFFMFAFCSLVISGVRCSLAGACSSCDSVGLYQHSWEFNSVLSPSVQSTLCRQSLLLQGRCTEVWSSALPSGWRWRTKGTLSKKLCCFCSPCALMLGLVFERPGIQDGALTWALASDPLHLSI